MPNYIGLELIRPKQCPSCRKTGYVSTQRWNGKISDHCNKCGVSFNEYGTASKEEIDQQHLRTKQIVIILDHCQITAKLGSQVARRNGISTELLADLVAAGLLHQPAPDLYFTSSRGRRFLEVQQAIKNLSGKEAKL